MFLAIFMICFLYGFVVFLVFAYADIATEGRRTQRSLIIGLFWPFLLIKLFIIIWKWLVRMMTKKVYKIRDQGTGLFSAGGTGPKWTKVGKTWSSMGQLKNHLHMFITHKYDGYYNRSCINKIPTSWEILEIEVSEVTSTTMNAKQIMDAHLKLQKGK